MKGIYYLVIRIYILWSRFYRFCERLFSHNYKNNKEEIIRQFKTLTIPKKWDEVLNILHYENDKPYHLWDVTSDPFYVLKREWGDCDDYSAVAYTLFGDELTYNRIKYKYKGTYYLLYKKLGGHVVSIWENKKGTKFLTISTQAMQVYNSVNDFLKTFEKEISYVAHVKAEYKKNFQIKFGKIYNIKEFEKISI